MKNYMTLKNYNPSSIHITLTEAALQHFTEVLAGQVGKMIRLSTKQNGCSGHAYVLDLVNTAQQDDLVLKTSDAVTLVIAAEALQLLEGTEIDITSDGINKTVKFNNPNAIGECGCGESFTIA